MTVTHFHDMHSGGELKTKYGHIFVEASKSQAVEFFNSWFDRDPHHVTCSCCGADFSVTKYQSLRYATAYLRNCQFKEVDREQGGGHYIEAPKTIGGEELEHLSVEEYLDHEDVAFFSSEDVEKELIEVVD